MKWRPLSLVRGRDGRRLRKTWVVPTSDFRPPTSDLQPPNLRPQGPGTSNLSLHATLRFSVRDLVFFYGTLMAGFDRRRRAGIDDKLRYIGRGSIRGALFDLGLYPAPVPPPHVPSCAAVHH